MREQLLWFGAPQNVFPIRCQYRPATTLPLQGGPRRPSVLCVRMLRPRSPASPVVAVRAAPAALVLALLCLAGPADAEEALNGGQATSADASGPRPPDAETAAARARSLELFEQSSTAYDKGDFSGAAALLERAYAAFPEPVLLYNLGRAREGLGEDEAAIAAYEKYLVAQADTKDRGAITRRLQTLKQRVEERRHRAAEAEECRQRTTSQALIAHEPLEVRQRRRPLTSVLPWIVSGVGGLGLASGGVLWLLAVDRHDRARYDADAVSAQHEQSEARDFARGATIALVSGGILAAAGAAWGIVTLTSAHPDGSEPQLGLVVAPGALWLAGSL
jgi:tetratricopeptide (TPR) repeat protein